jgi:hypothetical protein
MVAAPASRCGAMMTAFRGEVVLFGGSLSEGPSSLGDTWTWNAIAWTKQMVTGPSQRSQAVMATW